MKLNQTVTLIEKYNEHEPLCCEEPFSKITNSNTRLRERLHQQLHQLNVQVSHASDCQMFMTQMHFGVLQMYVMIPMTD